jgi:hydroxypyruvate reductase
VLDFAFRSVDAGEAVKKYLGDHPLPPSTRVKILGLGKAACAMVQAAAAEISPSETLVLTKHASPLTVDSVTLIEGNHPVPGEKSLHAGEAALKLVTGMKPEELLLCLISGGGSALMAAPYVSLSDLQILTSSLLACGARIDEINILRRHLDRLKGGGVVRLSNGAHILGLLLSDVVDDSIESIASGPTAPDPATIADAVAILKKYNLQEKIPSRIENSLRETIKPGDPLLERVQNIVIASNEIALQAALDQSHKEGFRTLILQKGIQGEARDVGRGLALAFRGYLDRLERPFCLLAGGETTVTINGNGMGGRNQELALAAVDVLAGLKDVLMISLATDGEDGPTDAAGAVVSGETAQRAGSLGNHAADFLSRNDAYHFFEALHDLIRTGPTGTNVNDLVLCFAF